MPGGDSGLQGKRSNRACVESHRSDSPLPSASGVHGVNSTTDTSLTNGTTYYYVLSAQTETETSQTAPVAVTPTPYGTTYEAENAVLPGPQIFVQRCSGCSGGAFVAAVVQGTSIPGARHGQCSPERRRKHDRAICARQRAQWHSVHRSDRRSSESGTRCIETQGQDAVCILALRNQAHCEG
jgi:hypothetical protein